MSSDFLLHLALILLSTKLFALITKKIKMPQVVGSLFAGLILGPAVLNVINETEFIKQIAELGVIILMFMAGLETDISELKNSWKPSFLIASFGALVPFIGGFLVATAFNEPVTEAAFLQNLFMGVVLTATSVSITVETLKEIGKISTRAGNAILGAALIDDIIGIIGLTIVTSLAGSDVSVAVVLGKIVAFFVLAGVVGVVMKKIFAKWVNKYTRDLRRFVVVSFALCLVLAYVAEHHFGVAGITGAFIAGLIIANTSHTHYIEMRFETLSYMLLSPIFFASIGLQVVMPEITGEIILFMLVLTIVAILAKIIGCWISARMCKYSNMEAFQIGTGMVSRGEVALIMLAQGMPLGLVEEDIFAPVVIVVIATTIISPILLKVAFADKK